MWKVGPNLAGAVGSSRDPGEDESAGAGEQPCRAGAGGAATSSHNLAFAPTFIVRDGPT